MSKNSAYSLMNGNINIQNPNTGTRHRTSIRMEKLEWDTLRRICATNGITIHDFCSYADAKLNRKEHSRTSRIRCAILQYCVDNGNVFDRSKKIEQKQWQC
jgi:predicted DNA-binding ribbon-helix-helix protein